MIYLGPFFGCKYFAKTAIFSLNHSEKNMYETTVIGAPKQHVVTIAKRLTSDEF